LGQGKKALILRRSLKVKTAKELSWNDLCALCFFLSHFLAFVLPSSAEDNEKVKIFFPKH
jgi:hypothetical protein